MKSLPFELLARGLIVAIVMLMLVARWVAASIVDRELAGRSTALPWPTATFLPENPALTVSSTSTGIETPISSLSATATPTLMAPTNRALPPARPTLGPNPQACAACHQNIRGGGG